MHRVLATLVATALLIGCSDPKAEQRDAYLASGEAHAAAAAAMGPMIRLNVRTLGPGWAADAADAAIEAADAVGTDEFYPAVRKADAAAAVAWEKVQDPEHVRARLEPAALEASRKAWEAAERAMASHD